MYWNINDDLFHLQHHCRHCGGIYCDSCSANKLPLPSSAKPVRVCDNCYEKLMENSWWMMKNYWMYLLFFKTEFFIIKDNMLIHLYEILFYANVIRIFDRINFWYVVFRYILSVLWFPIHCLKKKIILFILV